MVDWQENVTEEDYFSNLKMHILHILVVFVERH